MYQKAGMLRMTWLLVIEALVFALLSVAILSRPGDVHTSRMVGYVLVAITLFACVMALGQKRLLKPFVTFAGICKVCD